MQDFYEALEFNKIRQKVSDLCHTEKAKKLAGALEILPRKELDRELHFLREMDEFTIDKEALPIVSLRDLEKEIVSASKEAILSEEDLISLASLLEVSESLTKLFSESHKESDLREYALAMPSLSKLLRDIRKTVRFDFTISDNASSRLSGIRSSLSRLNKELRNVALTLLGRHKKRLTEMSLSMRSGHYVLPVKNSFKREVPGIALDVSNSGETVFIEPQELVEIDFKISSLEMEEKEEIRRILRELSRKVGENCEDLLTISSKVAYLDLLNAKVLYKQELRGVVADIADSGRVEVIQATHPLMELSRAVPNTFVLSKEERILIISGPNAGGKSIALKTLALAVLMGECALPVAAKEASFPYFSTLCLDMGDNQSLSENLSTFSSKMSNLASFLPMVDENSLAILDELGTGTSPKEGEALAISIAIYLKEKGAYALISSHYEGLKAYALSDKGMENASLEFDEASLEPTYKLRMGVPGESYGLEVASRYKLPHEIVERSRDLVNGEDTFSLKGAIEKLSKSAKESEEVLERARKKEEELNREKAHLEKLSASLEKRNQDFERDMRRIKNEMIEEYDEKLREMVKEASFGKKPHEIEEIRKKIKEEEVEEPIENINEEFSIGDYVSIPSLFAEGRLVSISGKTYRVDSRDGMTYRVKKNELRHSEEPKSLDKEMRSEIFIDDIGKGKALPMEINLIGLRVEEAKGVFEKYLDDCRIKGYKRVRIIHGFGSGALRKMVNDYCNNHSEFIITHESASGEEGGGGATIVHLK